MKSFQLLLAAMLLMFVGSVYAEKPQPVIEQNLDTNGDIKVAIQNTVDNPVPVGVQNTVDVNVTGGEIQAIITEGTVDAELIGGEVDVNIKTMPPCEAPLRYQLIGYSEEWYQGNFGLLKMTRVCDREFGEGARMCSSVEVMESTGQVPLPGVGAWVRPVLVGDPYRHTDASGVSAISPEHGISCDGWTSDSLDFRGGLLLASNGGFRLTFCYSPYSIACCAPMP